MKEQRAQHKRGESIAEPMEISEESLCRKAVETYDIFVQLGRVPLQLFSQLSCTPSIMQILLDLEDALRGHCWLNLSYGPATVQEEVA